MADDVTALIEDSDSNSEEEDNDEVPRMMIVSLEIVASITATEKAATHGESKNSNSQTPCH